MGISCIRCQTKGFFLWEFKKISYAKTDIKAYPSNQRYYRSYHNGFGNRIWFSLHVMPNQNKYHEEKDQQGEITDEKSHISNYKICITCSFCIVKKSRLKKIKSFWPVSSIFSGKNIPDIGKMNCPGWCRRQSKMFYVQIPHVIWNHDGQENHACIGQDSFFTSRFGKALDYICKGNHDWQ